MDELIINELQKILLLKENHNLIKEQLTKLFPSVVKVCEIHANAIVRINSNTLEEPVFDKVSRISYKQKGMNKKYQRASIPNETMFYGVFIDDVTKITEKLLSSGFEAVELLRDNKSGEEIITVSVWRIEKPLVLFSVSEEVNVAQTYLANEFSKKVDKNHPEEYMISAIMSELIAENGLYDGVIYPSVQTKGIVQTQNNEMVNSLCVALCPKVIDEGKVRLVLASQHRVIVDKNGFADLSKAFNYCEIKEGQTELLFTSL